MGNGSFMKRILYLFALLLTIVTAIGYTIAKNREKEAQVSEVEISRTQQVRTWRMQALQGIPQAQYQLGIYYEKDRGDYLNAQKWYRVAATKGQHGGAQYKLANLYMNGQGVENNLAEAMKWFRQSAAKGDVRAQFFMGVALRDGWERKSDFIEAYKWFLLANRDAPAVRAENPRFDPMAALAELDGKMSRFDRKQARQLARSWRAR